MGTEDRIRFTLLSALAAGQIVMDGAESQMCAVLGRTAEKEKG